MAGATQVKQHVFRSNGGATILLKRLNIEDLTIDNLVDVEGYVVPTY